MENEKNIYYNFGLKIGELKGARTLVYQMTQPVKNFELIKTKIIEMVISSQITLPKEVLNCIEDNNKDYYFLCMGIVNGANKK